MQTIKVEKVKRKVNEVKSTANTKELWAQLNNNVFACTTAIKVYNKILKPTNDVKLARNVLNSASK